MPRRDPALPRPRPSRQTLLLVLLLPVALTLLAVVFIASRARQTLQHIERDTAHDRQLVFSIRPLDLAASSSAATRFEPVAPAATFTSGIFFDGQFYLAGPAGLTATRPDGSPQFLLRTGLELPVAPITALASGRLRGASEPALLIATAGQGLLLLTPAAPHPVLRQLLPATADTRDLTALLPLATGDLLIGTRHHGVLLFNGTTLTQLPLPGTDPAQLEVTALAPGPDPASCLIGTRNRGVFSLHAGTVDHADTTSGLPDDQVLALATHDGHAYAGTPLGIADFDLAGSAPLRPQRILAPGLFSQALAAQGSQLTVGTLDQGVRQVALDTRATLRHISISNDTALASTQRVDALIPTPGALFSLIDGRLMRHTGTTWTPAVVAVAGTLTDRNISALAFAPDGTLYIGYFDRGVDLLRPALSSKDTAAPIRHLEDDRLFCINRLVLDPARGTIAAATANGLVLFDDQGNPRQPLTRYDGLLSEHITDIVFAPGGATALATPAGITLLTPSGAQSLNGFQGLVNNHVYALAALPAPSGVHPAHILAGTLGGLSLLDGAAVKRSLTTSNSALPHNWITALLPQPDGVTLIGTYGAGLATLDLSGHIAPVELPAGTPRDLVINPNALFATTHHRFAGTLGHGLLAWSSDTGRWSLITNGLPSLNVTAFAERGGQIYIGTDSGLVRIAEASLP